MEQLFQYLCFKRMMQTHFIERGQEDNPKFVEILKAKYDQDCFSAFDAQFDPKDVEAVVEGVHKLGQHLPFAYPNFYQLGVTIMGHYSEPYDPDTV